VGYQVTDKILLPDEIIDGVRSRLEYAEPLQWDLGDFLVDVGTELYPYLKGAGIRYPRAYTIREISSRVGCDPSTLRDRETMARFFPQEIRSHWQPPLTYSHLRACKAAGDAWESHASWAVDNLPAPPAVIRARVKTNGHLAPAWQSRWERMLELADTVYLDQDAPRSVRDLCEKLLVDAAMEAV